HRNLRRCRADRGDERRLAVAAARAAQSERGLVMFGIGNSPSFQYSAVHLGWMPLPLPRTQAGTITATDLTKVRYFTEDGWSPDPEKVLPIFGVKAPNLLSISAAFLPGPQKWI